MFRISHHDSLSSSNNLQKQPASWAGFQPSTPVLEYYDIDNYWTIIRYNASAISFANFHRYSTATGTNDSFCNQRRFIPVSTLVQCCHSYTIGISWFAKTNFPGRWRLNKAEALMAGRTFASRKTNETAMLIVYIYQQTGYHGIADICG